MFRTEECNHNARIDGAGQVLLCERPDGRVLEGLAHPAPTEIVVDRRVSTKTVGQIQEALVDRVWPEDGLVVDSC